jgi:hypothetical protein
MPIDKELIETLVLEEISGCIKEPDRIILENLLQEEPEARDIFEEIYKKLSIPGIQQSIDQLSESMSAEKIIRPIHAKRKRKQFYVSGIAASIFMVAFVSILLNFSSSKHPVVPSLQNITLSFPNGDIINVDNLYQKQLRFSDLILQTGRDSLHILLVKRNMEINVPAGRVLTVILPDNSTVQLNACSVLQVPGAFLKSTREVGLPEGEAYFSINADQRHPFMVRLKDQSNVQVLGTTFNINTYEEQTTIVLLKGVVKVATRKQSLVVKPGYAVSCKYGSVLKLKPCNTSYATSWRNDIYAFESINIEQVGRLISRCYGIRVVTDSSDTGALFIGRLNKKKPVEHILKALTLTRHFHYTFDKDKVLHIR